MRSHRNIRAEDIVLRPQNPADYLPSSALQRNSKDCCSGQDRSTHISRASRRDAKLDTKGVNSCDLRAVFSPASSRATAVGYRR